MKTILVSLISDQLLPNLLFIKEMESKVTQHIFVTSDFMESKGKSEQLAQVAGLVTQQWQKVVVKEDSLDNIRQALEAHKPSSDDKYLLNLTGGTKIMSIGVNRFFEDLNHESYYLTLGKNSYKRIYPKDNDRETPISYQIALKEYLMAYSFQIEKSGLPSWATEALAQRFYKANLFPFSKDLHELRQRQQKNKGAAVQMPPNDQLSRLLQMVQWQPQKKGWLNAEEIQFLISGWWEAYIYFRLKIDLTLTDDAIDTSCHIKRSGAPNEMDVMFLKNNQLFVVECKTGFEKYLFKDNLNDAVYKMAALRNSLGLRIPGYLCMLDSKLRDNSTQKIKKDYLDRAAAFDTKLVDRTILNDANEWKSVIKIIN